MAPQREWFEKDYYKVLGVSDSATEKEIKAAYRQLSKKHHPDSGGDEDKFKEVSAAWDVLGDAAKRKEYDEVRRLGPMAGGFAGPGGAGPGGGFQFNVDDLGDLRRPVRRPVQPRPAPGRRGRAPAGRRPRGRAPPRLPRRGQRRHHHGQRHQRRGLHQLQRHGRGAGHLARDLPDLRRPGRHRRQPGAVLLQPAVPGLRRHRA